MKYLKLISEMAYNNGMKDGEEFDKKSMFDGLPYEEVTIRPLFDDDLDVPNYINVTQDILLKVREIVSKKYESGISGQVNSLHIYLKLKSENYDW